MKIRSLGLMGVSTLALMISGLPQAVSAAAPAPAGDDSDTIIVTGTRDVGVKAQESPTPIEVIGSETLAATGQNNVFDALKNVLPSFSSSSENYDTSEMVRSARLRGMSPGEVLVLVNGKRRHNTANVNADAGPDVGSNPADLDMIPLSMIDHVEVLLDGAAAQYGSDAVAGVVNIILKSNASGTMLSTGAGITTRGDGAQANGSASQGIALGSDGFLTIGVDYRHQDYESRGGMDCRSSPTLTLASNPNCSPQQASTGPTRNHIDGKPLMDLVTGGFNAEKPINDNIELYGFGTAGWRSATAYENDRLGSTAPTVWPLGFSPRETLDEVDGAITGGVRGKVLGWDWDLSTTYGQDSDDIGIIHSVNTGMLSAVGFSPLSAYAGNETNTQLTTNLDIRRGIETGIFAAPLNVAFGAEYRHETYSVGAGDAASYLDGGLNGYAGFTPTDASNSTRNVEAGYIDLSTKILPKWTVDIAGRFESYDSEGVGNTFNKKLTTRYDFFPELGIRGTISDGFHAPTLAQTNFATTNIGPTEYGGQKFGIQLPVSSPGAALLGAPPLHPEKSKDIDFGIVAEPLPKLHLTADVYQIFLDGRIINTGSLSSLTNPTVLAAIQANGNSLPTSPIGFVPLPPPHSQCYNCANVNFFTNGVNTRTRGLDIGSDYKTDFNQYGSVKWTLNANFNATSITGYAKNLPDGTFAPNVISDITKSSPTNKISLAANWMLGGFDVTLRETRYGHVDENVGSSAVVPYDNIYIKSAYITDIDIGYNITDAVKLDIGGNNVFDHMPSKITLNQQSPGRLSGLYPSYTPWGLDGAYFYTRITAMF